MRHHSDKGVVVDQVEVAEALVAVEEVAEANLNLDQEEILGV